MRLKTTVGLAVVAVYLLLRLPKLTALPIFVDESFYIHWAQLVRASLGKNAFVSLVDPKPPLHSWLLAAILPLSRDPLWAGRFLSVLCGAVLLLLLFQLCPLLQLLLRPNGTLEKRDASRLSLRIWASVLVISCPYLAFYQRLSLADALFVSESTAVGWLSLAVARAVWASEVGALDAPARPRSLATQGFALGGVLGSAMLTRQNFSYLLWALPPLALLLWPRASSSYSFRKAVGRFSRTMLVASLFAFALWSPILLVPPRSEFWKRIFYQARFFEGLGLRGTLKRVIGNAEAVFLPFDRSHNVWRLSLERGWYWAYLSPPIYLLVGIALVWLAAQRQWRALTLLVGWFLLTCLPVVLFGQILFPRYALLSVVPLLLAVALMLSSASPQKGPPPQSRVRFLASIFAAVAVAWPTTECLRQITDWRTQRLLPEDRLQYVSGWPAGYAVRQAVVSLEEMARTNPLVVINLVGDVFPNMAVAVFLHHSPTAPVYYTQWDSLELNLAKVWPQDHRLLLRRDYRFTMPTEVIEIPAKTTVVCVSPDPYYWLGQSYRTGKLTKESQGRFEEIARFTNSPTLPGAVESEPAIVLYRLR